MKNLLIVLLGSLLLTACSKEAPRQEPVAADSSTDAPTTAPDDATSRQSVYDQAIASPSRLTGDYARDAGRKPGEVLAFFGIGQGDVVLDLFSGGGYYTELLSRVVGPDGTVVAQTNEAYLGFVGDEFNERYANDRLPNTEVLMAENNELALAPERFDAVTMILAYHDLFNDDAENGWEKIDVPMLLAELYQGLRPGGIVGIVDHYADPGAPPETGNTLHRIDPALVISAFEAAGFALDGKSDVLRNDADDHSKGVFDPEIRGKTDRFVLRFKKPV